MDEKTPLTSHPFHSVQDRVAQVIDQIRPAIQADGGDVELVDITDQAMVRIRFHGACISCPSRLITLKSGLEQSIMEHVPEVTGVQQID